MFFFIGIVLIMLTHCFVFFFFFFTCKNTKVGAYKNKFINNLEDIEILFGRDRTNDIGAKLIDNSVEVIAEK